MDYSKEEEKKDEEKVTPECCGQLEPHKEADTEGSKGESTQKKVRKTKTRRGKKRQHSAGEMEVTYHKKKTFSNMSYKRQDSNRIKTRRYSSISTAANRGKHKKSRVRFKTEVQNRPQKYSLRPVNVPKAPENSTQFLIDDHKECKLYKSFEVDFNPNQSDVDSFGLDKLYGEDLDTMDMQQRYFVNDFEHSYHIAKEEYLADLKKEHLIAEIKALERKLKDLESILEENKSTKLLRNLQVKLVSLQEQNQMLKRENNYLKGSNERSTEQVPSSEEVAPSSESSSDDETSSTCTGSSSNDSMSDCGSSCSECERGREKVEIPTVLQNGHSSDIKINGHATPRSSNEDNPEEVIQNDIMVDEVTSSKNII